MTTKSTTQPAALAVSLAAVKETLRIMPADTSLDLTISLWCRGVIEDAEHELGRSLVTQGWRLTLDEFPDALRLDYPPLISVQSVTYYDANDVLQTLDPADYLVDNVTEPGYVVPGRGKAWPDTSDRVNAVMVDYTAGYGVSDASVPACVQLYILAKLVEQFDPATKEFKETAQSVYVARLLDRCRVYQ